MRIWIDLVESHEKFSPEYVEFLKLLADHTGALDTKGMMSDHRKVELFNDNMALLQPDIHALYRCTALKDWSQMDPEFDFRNQETVKANFFLSTTTDEEIADGYFHEWDSDANIFIKFEIIPSFDTRAIVVNDYEDDLVHYDEMNPGEIYYSLNENEVILDRSTFKVRQKEQKPCEWKPAAEYWEVELKH